MRTSAVCRNARSTIEAEEASKESSAHLAISEQGKCNDKVFARVQGLIMARMYSELTGTDRTRELALFSPTM